MTETTHVKEMVYILVKYLEEECRLVQITESYFLIIINICIAYHL